MLISYNIHNILKIRTNAPLYVPEYFKVSDVDPNLSIIMTGLDPDLNGAVKIGQEAYELNDGSLYIKGSFLFRPWKLLMRGDLSERMEVYIDFPSLKLRAARLKLHRIASSLMYAKALQDGMTFLHSACVAKDSEGILICSFPGIGKTVTCYKILSEPGFSYMSNDITIFGNGKAYCYPHRFGIRNIDAAKALEVRLNIAEKLRILLRRLPFGNMMLEDPKIEADTNIKDEAEVGRVYFLEAKTGRKVVKELNKDEALAKILAIRDQSVFFSFLTQHQFYYSYLSPQYGLEELLKKERSILESLVKESRCCTVRGKKYHEQILGDLKH